MMTEAYARRTLLGKSAWPMIDALMKSIASRCSRDEPLRS